MDEIRTSYTFYPLKNDPCPNVGACAHAGGVSSAALVLQGNNNELFHRFLHGTIDSERERNRLLLLENENPKAEWEQVELELRREPEVDTPPILPAKKRGAPVGHAGYH